MRIRVVGAGALGLLLAGGLGGAIKGKMQLVTRTERQADEIRRLGVAVEEGDRSLTSYPAVIADRSAELLAAPEPDILLVTVKQTAMTDEFARRLAAQAGEAGTVVCFQNGIGHAELLGRYIAPDRLLLAVTTEAARKLSDNAVRHTGRGTTWIGGIDRAESASGSLARSEIINMQAKKIAALLNEAGFQGSASNNIMSRIWHKLLINAIINPLTALLRIPNGELMSSPWTVELMRAMLEESRQVGIAKRVEPPGPSWEQLEEVCRLTAANTSSMLQDVLNGKPTEIDRITGSLLAEAAAHGVPMPRNETVYRLIKAAEAAETNTE